MRHHSCSKLFSLFLCLSVFSSTNLAAAEPAPEFKLPSTIGEITLSQFRDQVVYVDFWASWCGPCRKSFPWMNSMHQRYGRDGLVIIAINLDTKDEKAEAFLEKVPAEFIIAYDKSGKVPDSYQVIGMPTSYLINRSGEMIKSHVGFRERDKESLEKDIRQALAQ
ncbi:MAG: TlpA family protein disulfide reductase [Gammaproteobacteria bacterium]